MFPLRSGLKPGVKGGGYCINKVVPHIHFEAALVCRVQPRNEVYLSLFYRIPNC